MATPNDPARGMYRRDGHDTSQAAAIGILGKKTVLQKIVLAKFLEAGARGLTLYELEALCNDHRSTMRTRCSELVAQGLIVDTKEKRLINGQWRKVWRIATPADAAEGDLVDLMLGGRVEPLQALLGRGFQSEFRDRTEVEAYLRANHLRLVGEEGGQPVYKSAKGYRFTFDPGQNPIVGRLTWEKSQANVTRPDEGPKLTDATPTQAGH
jgi:hypothetical protein